MEDFDTAPKNTFNYLKSGGIFGFVLPDLAQLAGAYMADDSALGSVKFMESMCLGKKKSVRGLRGLFVEMLENSAHLWLWDEKLMREQLLKHAPGLIW